MMNGDGEDFDADESGMDIMTLDMAIPVELGLDPGAVEATIMQKCRLVIYRVITFSWLTLLFGVLFPLPAILLSVWSVRNAATYDGDNIYGATTHLVASGMITTIYYLAPAVMYSRIRARTASIGAATVVVQAGRAAISFTAIILWFVLSLRDPSRSSSKPMNIIYLLLSIATILTGAISLFLVRFFNFQARRGIIPFVFGTVRDAIFMNAADTLVSEEDDLEQLGGDRELDTLGSYRNVPDDGSDDEGGEVLDITGDAGEAQREVEDDTLASPGGPGAASATDASTTPSQQTQSWRNDGEEDTIEVDSFGAI